eukprot:CAMPEP_0185181756 /NCGR_PEP_ID=MMETSP1140-20130426/852_1 /TAXON_ID=298111 /ORGANISM="Pavlova sp., Strain CCMP459" /LENGTH=43 /DNA_ID= /DNA_START= /DNA_END= /DNA_ORIENTATION=
MTAASSRRLTCGTLAAQSVRHGMGRSAWSASAWAWEGHSPARR